MRSANWEHLWLHEYDMLADGTGINGVTLGDVLREKRTVVSELVNLAVPALLTQDAKVAAIVDLPEDPSSHREVAESRRTNKRLSQA